MKNTKLAMGLGAAVLAVGATIGATSLAHAAPGASASATASASASASATPKAHRTGTAQPTAKASTAKGTQSQALAGVGVKELAQKLGTDETKTKQAVQQARKDVQAARKANPKLTAAEAKDTAETSIAKSLGVDKAKVTTAVNEILAEHKSEARAALKARLDKAVQDGKITQADEDSILKAYDAGVLTGQH